MKIAHISDLHLNRKFRRRNLEKTERLIEFALSKLADHIVITGDISDNSNERDFADLRELLIKYDLFHSDKVSVVIGNHDIFGGVELASDIIDFPSRCEKTNYNLKVEIFYEYFRNLFDSTVTITEGKRFPYLKIFNDTALIGVNSVNYYSKLKNPFASNGKVKKSEREEIDMLLSAEEIRNKEKIVLIHHHFYKNSEAGKSSENSIWSRIESHTMKLRGKKKLLSLFKRSGVRIIMHGHSHDMRLYERKGIVILNAGASVDGTASSLFLVDIGQGELNISSEILPPINVKMSDYYNEPVVL
ncbi:metallophosphoesterase family protein [Melioribacter sp. Ez-97]|uniref:metallophosphoesterase family protein n=1 Tax=Melioribacter sp. Ez-97 TaxID=3423434 RepID=UPI003ED92659